MSLTNPNTPVSQQDLQDFYHKIVPYMGGSSGGASAMSDLTDVDINELQDEQVLAWDETAERWVNVSTSIIPSSAKYDLIPYAVDLVINGSYTQPDEHTVDYVIAPASGYEGLSIHLNNIQQGLMYFVKVDVKLVEGTGATSTSYPWKIGINPIKMTSFNEPYSLSEGQFFLPMTLGEEITYQFEFSATNYMTLNLFTGGQQGSATLRISNIRAGMVGSGVSPVEVTQIQSTGTKIATLTVNGEDTDLYAPNGGGGGGHTIEDSEGIELEQREVLQFGEGFIAEDDDTNEKTVISPDVMQSGDMSDVITPLPSVRPSRSTIVKQVLTAGETTITFNDIPTTGDYIVDFFNSLGINYTSVAQTTGAITLTYPVQANDLDVYCEIREV